MHFPRSIFRSSRVRTGDEQPWTRCRVARGADGNMMCLDVLEVAMRGAVQGRPRCHPDMGRVLTASWRRCLCYGREVGLWVTTHNSTLCRVPQGDDGSGTCLHLGVFGGAMGWAHPLWT